MSDNVTLNPGTGGAVVATDDVSGVHYQVVKHAVGGDGAASLVSETNRFPVGDRFAGGETLADQAGEGAALTFTFASPVDLVWVRCDGGDGRANPFGGTPTSAAGIFCEDGVPNPITVTTSSVKVYAESGTTVRVWGFRY
jgi:hypothetical protein